LIWVMPSIIWLSRFDSLPAGSRIVSPTNPQGHTRAVLRLLNLTGSPRNSTVPAYDLYTLAASSLYLLTGGIFFSVGTEVCQWYNSSGSRDKELSWNQYCL
jgi:hypothetical protein